MKMAPERLRIKKGWGNEGQEGIRVGPDLRGALGTRMFGQAWTPIQWDDEDDPDWHKTAGLEPVPSADEPDPPDHEQLEARTQPLLRNLKHLEDRVLALEHAKEVGPGGKETEVSMEPGDVWRPIENLFVYEVVAKTEGSSCLEAWTAAYKEAFTDGVRAAFRNIRLAKALPR